VPSISLVDQTVDRFAEQGIEAVGVMQGYHPRTDSSQPVQVASIQTLARRRIPKADIVLVDEAHLWFKFIETWMAMPEWQSVPFVGLSATPWTKGLGQHYDDLIVAARLKDLIDKGFLSPFRAFAPSHPDLSKVGTLAGDYNEEQSAEVMSQPVLVANVVSTWLANAENRPTLCFAVNRAHARKLANEFEAAGIPTGYVDMDTERDERDRIGKRLEAGQIKVVCNVGCLTTGVDWDVRCIVLARPTKSEMLLVQILGRGLRTAPGKVDCLFLDHSDTMLRLGFPTDIHHDALDMGRRHSSQSKKAEREPALPKECSVCSFLKPAGVRKCSSCGFEPEPQSHIEERSGELVQLNGKRVKKGEATIAEKQRFYSMALWHAFAKGHKPTSAAWSYKEKFRVWPRGLSDATKPPDAEFLNWAKSRDIARARAKAKARAAEKSSSSVSASHAA
jgi:superfamily II DNA or RNA helicase